MEIGIYKKVYQSSVNEIIERLTKEQYFIEFKQDIFLIFSIYSNDIVGIIEYNKNTALKKISYINKNE